MRGDGAASCDRGVPGKEAGCCAIDGEREERWVLFDVCFGRGVEEGETSGDESREEVRGE